jgi:hypothetical protein
LYALLHASCCDNHQRILTALYGRSVVSRVNKRKDNEIAYLSLASDYCVYAPCSVEFS